MCYKPIKIKSRSKLFSMLCSSVFNTVACGKCEECLDNKRSEYLVRSYVQALDCVKHGGFYVFETLTFSNYTIPYVGHINVKKYDVLPFSSYFHFLCFNSDYYRIFMQKLRRLIKTYRTYEYMKDKDGNFIRYKSDYKYKGKVIHHRGEPKKIFYRPFKDFIGSDIKVFFVSELGKKTNRPHHHAMFYVNIPNLSPLLFRTFVKRAWTFGFIDRIQTYTKRVNNLGKINYIYKYVTKDFHFNEQITKKITEGVSTSAFKFYNRLDRKEQRKRLPFHRQSQGFGLNIDLLSCDFSTCRCVIGNKSYKIPLYNLRKKFYRLVTHNLGSSWRLTPEGVHWKVSRLDSLISSVAQKFSDFYFTVSQLPNFNYFRKNVDKYLNGRSWLDFAKYLVVYKDRFCPFSELPPYKDFYFYSIQDFNYYDAFNHLPRDYSSFDCELPRLYETGSDVLIGSDTVKVKKYVSSIIPFRDCLPVIYESSLYKHGVVCEDSFSQFSDYDKLYCIVNLFFSQYNVMRQNYAYDNSTLSVKLNKLFSLNDY